MIEIHGQRITFTSTVIIIAVFSSKVGSHTGKCPINYIPVSPPSRLPLAAAPRLPLLLSPLAPLSGVRESNCRVTGPSARVCLFSWAAGVALSKAAESVGDRGASGRSKQTSTPGLQAAPHSLHRPTTPPPHR
jgi:hypothetical protein